MTRKEVAQYIHVFFIDPVHGMFWRGDWLDNFEDSCALTQEDRGFWRSWLRDSQDFLDEAMDDCRRQAASNQNMSGTYEKFSGEYMIHMTMPASSLGSRIIPSRIKPYTWTQWMEREHKLPESVRQLDYEMAVNFVTADLQDHGYITQRVNRDRISSPSLIAQSRSGALAVRIVVARAPNEANFSASSITELKAGSPTDVTEFAFACVVLLPAAPRLEDGRQVFYMKYEGIKRV
ncbi:MAG: hypothetical protein EOM20_15050 [Spartobacteria bacterium]|nr:hypothetical protein [Spartobacteria bacterium]